MRTKEELLELSALLKTAEEKQSEDCRPALDKRVPIEQLDSPKAREERIWNEYLDGENFICDGTRASALEYAAREMFQNSTRIIEVKETQKRLEELLQSELSEEEKQNLTELYVKTALKLADLTLDTEALTENFRYEFPRAFAARLRQVRTEKGLTLAKLSTLSGIDHISLNRYEVQGRIPTAMSVYRLARVLGVSSDWLLGLTD